MSARTHHKSTVALGALMLLVPAACKDEPATPAAARSSTPASPSAAQSTPAATADPAQPPQLPRGGRTVFPRYQLVSYVGFPGSPALGPFDRDLEARAARLERQAVPYAAGRVAQPVMELIVVVANSYAGPDRKYRARLGDAEIDRYLAVARRHKMLMLLDVQPGRADPLTEIRRFEKYLSEPDIGLAFDPEWAVGPGQVPGEVYGHTSGAELDSIAAYLSGLVAKNNLPEKVFVFHQLSRRILSNEVALRRHPGVVTIKSVDGIGHMVDKIITWHKLTPHMAPGVHAGFKLFFDEDTRHGKLMTPAQVLALKPRPELITYE